MSDTTGTFTYWTSLPGVDVVVGSGWTVEYSDQGVQAYRPCPWCKGKSQDPPCARCKGEGYETRQDK